MVIREEKNDNFTTMCNYHLQEKDMSLKAKGLLSVMLSLSDDWDYSVKGLAAILKESEDNIKVVLKELERFGYLKRSRKTDEKGKFSGCEYDIYEKPTAEKPTAEKPTAEKPTAEKPTVSKPLAENPAQLNTKESNTKELNTKESKKEKYKKESHEEILSFIADEDLRELYREYIKMRKLIKAPMTERALTMLINKVNQLEPISIDRQKQLLETAIVNNWKSVYPLREERTSNQSQSGADPFMAFLNKELERIRAEDGNGGIL